MNKPKQLQPLIPSSDESGFTLIECLLAIIIVAVLLAAVAPAIVLAAGTRLQARRVEQATQAARTYVDGLRAGTIPVPPYVQAGGQTNVILLDKTKTNPVGNKSLFAGVPVPTGSATWTCTKTLPVQNSTASPPDPPPAYCADAGGNVYLYCVSVDGNNCSSTGPGSHKNFVIQAIRSVAYNQLPAGSGGLPYDPNDLNKGTKGYLLAIRVYRADALDGTGALRSSVDASGRAKRQLAYTAGVGDRRSPVLELTTEVPPPLNENDPGSRWKSLCDRLGGCTTTP